MMFAAFLARVKPVSTSAKPACIMKTRMAAMSVQTTFKLVCTAVVVISGVIFVSPFCVEDKGRKT